MIIRLDALWVVAAALGTVALGGAPVRAQSAKPGNLAIEEGRQQPAQGRRPRPLAFSVVPPTRARIMAM